MDPTGDVSRICRRQLRSLHKSIENNDTKLLQSWLNTDGINLNAALDGKNAVQLAILYGSADVCKLVLDSDNVDFSVETGNGYSLLHLACKRNDDNTEIVSLLLNRGLDPNLQGGNECETPIMIALRKGCFDVCEILIEFPDIDLTVFDVRKEFPIFRAAQIGSGRLIEKMLKKVNDRGKLDQANMSGMTPLMAVVNPWYDADVPVITELRGVANSQCPDERSKCLSLLLKAGLDTSKVNKHSRNVIEQASLFGDNILLAQLLDAGVDPNDLPKNSSSLGHQLVKDKINHYEELGILIQHPLFNPKALDKGLSLIDTIIIQGARALLPTYGALVGDSKIGSSREIRYEVFIDTLVEKGCPISRNDEDQPCGVLKAILDLGKPELMEYLFKAGMDVNDVVDSSKNTLLHLAMMKENVRMVEVLLRAKASIAVKNQSGLTPFDVFHLRTVDGAEILTVFQQEPDYELPISCLSRLFKSAIMGTRLKGVQALLSAFSEEIGKELPDHFDTWAVCVTERELLMDRLDRHLAIGKILLKHHNISVNKVKRGDGTETIPLHLAIGKGNSIMMRMLLDFGADMFMTDDSGFDAMCHVVRFHDRRLRLQMARILIGRGYHLPFQPTAYMKWIHLNSTFLMQSPWCLFRLLCVTILTRLIIPSLWQRLHDRALQLRGAIAAVETEQARNMGGREIPMRPDMVSPTMISALSLLAEMSKTPRLTDLARDAVRSHLGCVTRDKVVALPLPPRLHSHLLLETTFEHMPMEQPGRELDSMTLNPLSESVKELGGIEDWHVISFLSASR